VDGGLDGMDAQCECRRRKGQHTDRLLWSLLTCKERETEPTDALTPRHDGNIDAGGVAWRSNHRRLVLQACIVVSSQFAFSVLSQSCSLFSFFPVSWVLLD
jgi:hypothetical protein